jgi:hypothetical protein
MPPSETIVGHQRVFFFGAGASRPFGKMLMGEFVDSFKSKFSTPNTLLEQICKKERDLEFILEQLEEISATAYVYDARSRGVPTDYISNSNGGFGQTADALMDELRREIYLHYSSIENTESVKCFSTLFRTFDPDQRLHVVFTTNYDNAIECLCANDDDLNLMDGFIHKPRRREHVWSRRAFDEFKPSWSTDIVLFKLHGSANWLKRGHEIIQAPPDIRRKQCDV